MDKEPQLPASVPWDLIERSFGAALSREEQAKLEVWTTADPDHAQFVTMVRRAMASADSDVGKPDVNAIVVRTEERVRTEIVGNGTPWERSEREMGVLGRQDLPARTLSARARAWFAHSAERNPQHMFRGWFAGVADWTVTRLLGILGTPLSQEEADQMRSLIARAKKEKI